MQFANYDDTIVTRNNDTEVYMKPDKVWLPSMPKGIYMPPYWRKKTQIIKDCLMVGEATPLRLQLLNVIWK